MRNFKAEKKKLVKFAERAKKNFVKKIRFGGVM